MTTELIPTPQSAAWFRNRLVRDGICRAIYEEMKKDGSIYIFGEGAHMKVHFDAPDIEKDFPDRIITLPISEDGNTNFAVGASLLGIKPVVDVITSDFLFRTMDSLCNTAAKINFVSAGVDQEKTIVIRSEFIVFGPTTGQALESLFTHIPGLSVIVPSNPVDATGLMKTALSRKGTTLFFEDRMIPDVNTKETERKVIDVKPIPFGKAIVRRKGQNVTVLSYGRLLREAEILAEKHDLDCEIIDLRSLYPLDFDLISDSIEATGRLLIIEPDITYAGIGAEIAATINERSFGKLKEPIMRIGAPRISIPTSQVLHKEVTVTNSEIIDALLHFQKQLRCTLCGSTNFQSIEENSVLFIECKKCGAYRESK